LNYRTQYSLSPWAIGVDLQITPSNPRLTPSQLSQWQWCYQFSDGSKLRGEFFSPPPIPPTSSDSPEQPGPTPAFAIQQVGITEYLAAKTETPLLQWQPAQFICYELGQDLLLMASNDNYVANSLCLVNSPHRQWAQVTHWGSKLVAEPFVWDHFSIDCVKAKKTTALTVSWQFSPFVAPFFHWRASSNPESVSIFHPTPMQLEHLPWAPPQTISSVR